MSVITDTYIAITAVSLAGTLLAALIGLFLWGLREFRTTITATIDKHADSLNNLSSEIKVTNTNLQHFINISNDTQKIVNDLSVDVGRHEVMLSDLKPKKTIKKRVRNESH